MSCAMMCFALLLVVCLARERRKRVDVEIFHFVAERARSVALLTLFVRRVASQ